MDGAARTWWVGGSVEAGVRPRYHGSTVASVVCWGPRREGSFRLSHGEHWKVPWAFYEGFDPGWMGLIWTLVSRQCRVQLVSGYPDTKLVRNGTAANSGLMRKLIQYLAGDSLLASRDLT